MCYKVHLLFLEIKSNEHCHSGFSDMIQIKMHIHVKPVNGSRNENTKLIGDSVLYMWPSTDWVCYVI